MEPHSLAPRIICLVTGYAFGLIQTSYFIGKAKGIDIRDYGSGNAGTTNTMRTLGKKAGIITLAVDMLKAIAAIFISWLLFHNTYPEIMPLLKVYAGAGVVLGHDFPFYLNFRGGKGIAATAGMIIGMWNLEIFIFEAFVFFPVFFITHYVSLGSLLLYVGFVVISIILGQLHVGEFAVMSRSALCEMYIVLLVLTALAFYRHRDNIKRLLNGTERKTYLGKKKGGEQDGK
ncbi:MAG: glycerol-3-phosphate 1-O-acyltransferase PlsY [Lachnospiraceae bacterium]|nr:glycerol-3-phosphate 1-O-acyltransferase PlsY [Lachnospiraceae bacterium]